MYTSTCIHWLKFPPHTNPIVHTINKMLAPQPRAIVTRQHENKSATCTCWLHCSFNVWVNMCVCLCVCVCVYSFVFAGRAHWFLGQKVHQWWQRTSAHTILLGWPSFSKGITMHCSASTFLLLLSFTQLLVLLFILCLRVVSVVMSRYLGPSPLKQDIFQAEKPNQVRPVRILARDEKHTGNVLIRIAKFSWTYFSVSRAHSIWMAEMSSNFHVCICTVVIQCDLHLDHLYDTHPLK